MRWPPLKKLYFMKPEEVIKSSIAPLLQHLDIEKFRNKRIFVTGGTGFFGLWLLSAFKLLHACETDIQVTVLSRNPGGFLKKNPAFDSQAWLSFIQGDVKSFSLEGARFDYLVHAATDTSAQAQVDPLAIFDDVSLGSRRVFEFAKISGVRRMLVTSSGAVYGAAPHGVDHISENASFACQPNTPTSAYGEGKRVMEFLASAYFQKYGIETSIARCFAFVGPGLPLDTHFAIGNFISDALHKESLRVKGDGRAIRSYLYGADLAVWLLRLLTEAKPAAVYNVGSDSAINMKDLAQLVAATLAPEKPVHIASESGIDNPQRSMYVPSIERAQTELNLRVWTSLEEAIRHTAAYYLAKATG